MLSILKMRLGKINIVHGYMNTFWIHDGITLCIDPCRVEDDKKADMILISHEHYNHYSPDDINKVALPHSIIVVPEYTAQVMRADSDRLQNVRLENLIVLKAGDKISERGVRIKAVHAYIPGDYQHSRGRGLGFLLYLDGKAIYYAGDSALTGDMRNVTADGLIDIVILSLGNIMTVEEASEACNIIRARNVIVAHYDDLSQVDSFAEQISSSRLLRV